MWGFFESGHALGLPFKKWGGGCPNFVLRATSYQISLKVKVVVVL